MKVVKNNRHVTKWKVLSTQRREKSTTRCVEIILINTNLKVLLIILKKYIIFCTGYSKRMLSMTNQYYFKIVFLKKYELFDSLCRLYLK